MTLISGYPSDRSVADLEEIVPEAFRQIVAQWDDYDFLGARLHNRLFALVLDMINYGMQVSEGGATETQFHAQDILLLMPVLHCTPFSCRD